MHHGRARVEHLDALRGLAALSVVCHHYVDGFGVPNTLAKVDRTPLGVWQDGPAAVSLFFVLSGLVLSLKHFRTEQRPTLGSLNVRGYLASRACRIWLPYLVALAVTAFVWPYSATKLHVIPAPRDFMHWTWLEAPTGPSLFRQALLFQLHGAATANGYRLLPQAWTLAVELVFSALVPLGILVAARNVWVMLGAVVAGVAVGLPPYALHFALGIALARSYASWTERLGAKPAMAWPIGIAGLALYSSDLWLGDAFEQVRLRTGYEPASICGALGATGLLVFASANAAARGVLTWRPLRELGRTSFSSYLYHFAILCVITPRLLAWASLTSWTAAWAFGLVATVVVTLVAAELGYRAVEVPTMALGRLLSAGSRARTEHVPA